MSGFRSAIYCPISRMWVRICCAILELAQVLIALDASTNDDGRRDAKTLPREID